MQQHTAEGVSERIDELIVGVPVPQNVEVIVEAKLFSQRRAQHRTVEQVVDVPVRQFMEEIIEVMAVVCPERVSERIEEQVVVPVPKVVEKSVDVPGSQIRKENGEATQRIPQVRVSDHIAEQSIDVPADLGTNCRSGQSQPFRARARAHSEAGSTYARSCRRPCKPHVPGVRG